MVDERIILENGVEFCFKKLNDRNSSAVGIWVKEGARSEPTEHKGIAHYLEHLLFKGSTKYSYRKIKEEIEGKGGQLNGFTSQESTCYYARVLNKNIPKTLDILLDMVVNPLLKESDIERERQVILEEINMYNDMPGARVMSLIDELLWPKDPLGIDVIGSEESVKAIDKKAIYDFKDRFYHPQNIVVTICGSDNDKLKEMILDKVKKGDDLIKDDVKKSKVKIPKGFSYSKEIKPFNQTHLAMAFPGVDYFSKDRYVVELIHTILGANMSARLFESLREKRGLAYDVSTMTRKYSNTGAFMVHCGLDASKRELAVDLTIKELVKIKTKLVPNRELKRAKDYILGNLLMNFESTLNSMLYVGESIIARGKIISYEEIEQAILKVSPEDIKRVAEKIFDFKYMKVAEVTNQATEDFESKIISWINK